MQFINPMLLWGLLLLIFPILIHLFYFRRYKEVKFTNVKFLSELKEEKSVRDRLRQLLILLMRLGALAFLVLAFARPFLPGNTQEIQGTNSVSIYVDNSFSMQAFGSEVAHLDKAKRIAEKIISTYDREDEFQIIQNDFDYGDQRWLSGEAALKTLRDIELSPVSRDLNEILNRQKQIRYEQGKKNRSVYVISDFQKTILPENLELDTAVNVNFVFIESAKQPNLSIDSVWTEAPIFEYNQPNSLFIKVSNYGDADIQDAGLSLRYDGQAKPLGALAVNAGERKIDTFKINPRTDGWQHAEITVKDYPVEFDNSYHIAFEVPGKLRILSLYGAAQNSQLRSILTGLQSIQTDLSPITQVDYSRLNSYDLILLDNIDEMLQGVSQALASYIKNGGKVLLFPTMDQASSNYDDLITDVRGLRYEQLIRQEKDVFSVNREAYVFEPVFEPGSDRLALPRVNESFTMARQGNYPLHLLTFRDGSPFVTQVQSENGFLYQCASSLSEKSSSLLENTDIFIPMIYRMALQRNVDAQLSYTIGEESIVAIPHPGESMADEPVKIKGSIEFIPGQQSQGYTYILDMHNQVENAGVYDVVFRDSTIRKIAFNYNRSESDLQQASMKDLTEKYPETNLIDGVNAGSVENYIKTASLGKELWRWCLVLVLIFLALEQIFVRFLSKD